MSDIVQRAEFALSSPQWKAFRETYAAELINELLARLKAARAVNERLREYAGPGPYEPSDADGAKAPTWLELRALADHNFQLYANERAKASK